MPRKKSSLSKTSAPIHSDCPGLDTDLPEPVHQISSLESGRTVSHYLEYAESDDFLTDVLVDMLYLGFRTHKMNIDYYGNKDPQKKNQSPSWRQMLQNEEVFEARECTALLIREMVSNVRTLDETVDLFVSYLFPEDDGKTPFALRMKEEYRCFYDFAVGKTPDQVKLFQEHARRYFAMYHTKSGYTIDRTFRYNPDSTEEARAVATRHWKAGEEMRMCTAVIAELSDEEEYFLKDRDFSVMYSSKRQCTCLLMGPARFVNHDCEPNVRFLPIDQSLGISFRVLRDIQPGEEIVVLYSDHYFGENNCECGCASCERNKKGLYMSADDRVSVAITGTTQCRNRSKNARYNPAAYFSSVFRDERSRSPESKRQDRIPCRRCGTNILGENQSVYSAFLSADVVEYHGWNGGLEFDTCRLCRRHYLLYHHHFPVKARIIPQSVVEAEEMEISKAVAKIEIDPSEEVNWLLMTRKLSTTDFLKQFFETNDIKVDSAKKGRKRARKSLPKNESRSSSPQEKAVEVATNDTPVSAPTAGDMVVEREMEQPTESGILLTNDDTEAAAEEDAHTVVLEAVSDLLAPETDNMIVDHGSAKAPESAPEEAAIATALISLCEAPIPLLTAASNDSINTAIDDDAPNGKPVLTWVSSIENENMDLPDATVETAGTSSKAKAVMKPEPASVYWQKSSLPNFRLEKRHQRRHSAPACFSMNCQLLEPNVEYVPIFSNVALNVSTASVMYAVESGKGNPKASSTSVKRSKSTSKKRRSGKSVGKRAKRAGQECQDGASSGSEATMVENAQTSRLEKKGSRPGRKSIQNSKSDQVATVSLDVSNDLVGKQGSYATQDETAQKEAATEAKQVKRKADVVWFDSRDPLYTWDPSLREPLQQGQTVDEGRRLTRRSLGTTEVKVKSEKKRSWEQYVDQDNLPEYVPLETATRLPDDIPAPVDDPVQGFIPAINDKARIVWVDPCKEGKVWWPAVVLPEQVAKLELPKSQWHNLKYPEHVYVHYIYSRVSSGYGVRSRMRVFDYSPELHNTFREFEDYDTNQYIGQALLMLNGLIKPPKMPRRLN